MVVAERSKAASSLGAGESSGARNTAPPVVAAQGACSATVPATSDEVQGDVSAVRNTAALRRAHARRSTKTLEDGVPGRVGSREVQDDTQGQPSPSAARDLDSPPVGRRPSSQD
eukprot:4576508-Prymnesium_polylepis.1